MSSKTRNILLGMGSALAAIATVYTFLVRPWHLRWGASQEEVERPLPGDGLVPRPRINATHAVTVRAPASAIWPWLVQIGQGRGGFYSYDRVEQLMGLDIHTASHILPEHQALKVGDIIPLAPDGFGIPVAILEPGNALVLHGDTRAAQPGTLPNMRPGDYLNVSWGFYLFEQVAGITRLVERWRADWKPGFQANLAYWLFLEPGAFLMERKMLLGIQIRSETSWEGLS